MYLLDTNAISELNREKPDPNTVAFFEAAKEKNVPFFISALSLGEIRRSALKTNDETRAKRILDLLEQIETKLKGMILPITDEISHEWGRLMAINNTSPIDVFFAATAKVHGLTLITRNEKYFQSLGVDCASPFRDSQ